MRWISRATVLLTLCFAATNAKQRSRFDRSPVSNGRPNPRKGSLEPLLFSLSGRAGSNNVYRNDVPERIISKQALASSTAFLTGFVDVFSFRMNRMYANMMTGNSIKLMSAIGELHLSDTLHLFFVVLCYALGTTVYRTMVHFHNQQPKPHVAARATASPVILAMFALSDYLFYSKGIGTDWAGQVIPLALGFGMLNAAITDALGGTITFAMTGHISKLSQGISDWLFHSEPRKRRMRSATKASARILGIFLVGVLVGTWVATSGSKTVVMEASGMTLPSYLVEDLKLPVFTMVGLLCTALIQLYDRPFPALLWEILMLIKDTASNKRNRTNRGTLSVNIFSPAGWSL